MVKELTDISAFNHTQKKSFHIIIITIAIVTMAILSHIENWSVRVKSVVRFQESALPQLLPFAPGLRGHHVQIVQIYVYARIYCDSSNYLSQCRGNKRF